MKYRACGNCVSFQKLKQMVGNSGLCEWYDGRTDEDRGTKCEFHKFKKYERKRVFSKELEEQIDKVFEMGERLKANG